MIFYLNIGINGDKHSHIYDPMESDIERKIELIRKTLLKWWKRDIKRKVLFPWRLPGLSPYQALITEILLQRTRAEAVRNIYSEFFKAFPDAKSLSTASVDEIREAMKSLGLFWRATNLKRLGSAIIDQIPDNMEELLKLPNVGVYTAGAYLSLHRNRRAIIPDVNMARIVARIFGLRIQGETRRSKIFLNLCDQITPLKGFKEFNYAVIDFGRLICKPQNPLDNCCPIGDICEYANRLRSAAERN